MTSSNPKVVMEELVRSLTKRDPSGEALNGLRTAFGDWLLRSAETGTADAAGEFLLSGKRLGNLILSPRVREIVPLLYGPEGLVRLRQTVNTTIRLEAAIRGRGAVEGVIGDVPSKVSEIVSGISGAQIGRLVARRTGGGTVQTPGIIANLFRKMTENAVSNPARKLLIDAHMGNVELAEGLTGDQLYRALLSPTDNPARLAFVTRQLNAWAAAVLAREQGGLREDEK